jgi:hypothetical protein
MVPSLPSIPSAAPHYNYWKQQQHRHHHHHGSMSHNDVGSAVLFSDGANTHSNLGSSNVGPNANMMQMNPNSQMPTASGISSSALPSNVIQLEGDIDKVEKCLVRILGMVAGERWNPTGVIVPMQEGGIAVGTSPKTATPKGRQASSATVSGSIGGVGAMGGSGGGTATPRKGAGATTSSSAIPADAPTFSKKSKGGGNSNANNSNTASNNANVGAAPQCGNNANAVNAEAVIIAKHGTPTSKLPSLGKIKQVQRKTNTIIRRKKIHNPGGDNEVNEREVADLEGEVEPNLTEEEGTTKEECEDGVILGE